MNTFGVNGFDFSNEDDFWEEVKDRERELTGHHDYSEMGYDDLSNDYEPDPNDKTVAHIRCIEAGGCGQLCVLDYQEYRRQMFHADDRWRCTTCGGIADWIALFVPCSQCGELVNYEEDDVCEHCGKVFYEPVNPIPFDPNVDEIPF